MVRTVLLGPPGVGKGTQATRLAASRQIAHVATGDLFRAAVSEGTELGKQAKEYMTAGRLVPDDLVNDLVDWRLRRPDAERGFVMDGYPRTVPQAEALDRLLSSRGVRLDAVVLFEYQEQTLVDRASSRVVCRGCGSPYNTVSAPPKAPGVCDRCGQPLYRRDDDRPEVIRERLRVYREQTEPLVAYYEGQSLLRKVSADRSIDAVAKELDRTFPKTPATGQPPATPSPIEPTAAPAPPAPGEPAS